MSTRPVFTETEPTDPGGRPKAPCGDDNQPPSVAEQFLPMFLDGRDRRRLLSPALMFSHYDADLYLEAADRAIKLWSIPLAQLLENMIRMDRYRQQMKTRQRRPHLATPRYHDQAWTQRWAVYFRVRGVSDGE